MPGEENPTPQLVPQPEPQPQGSGARNALIAVVLLAVVGAGAYFYWQRQGAARAQQRAAAATVTKTYTVQRGDLDVSVRVAGTTTAGHYAVINAPRLRGRGFDRDLEILEVAVNGSFVKQGQKVAAIDPQRLKDRIDDELDQLNQAQNDVAKKKVELELAMETLMQSVRVAKANLDKTKLDAAAEEIRTPVDKELIRLDLEEADAAYKQVLSSVNDTKVSQAADMRNLELKLRQQQRDVDNMKRDLANYTLYAPMDGMVVMLSKPKEGSPEIGQIQKGDKVAPGQPFMKIIDPSSMEVEATINQSESSSFRIGQNARVGVDAFPGLELTAKLFSIGALASSPGREQYFIRNVPIRVQIRQQDKRVIPDLSASADVSIGRAEGVLIAPASAVEQKEGKAFVYVKSEQGFERRPVEVGPGNGTLVAVRTGLKEGDVIRTN